MERPRALLDRPGAAFLAIREALIVDSDEAMHDWAEALQKIALASLHHATKLAGDSPWALKGGIAADRYLRRQTRQLLNDEE